ncbi:hypothetical protein QR46_3494 [Giardia duodenalis assemblage B]|uniref:Uncharacterized protein n=1 Tax=Giardia duodenalis assemblage B TaxID=1394984 RepID=A0A132NR87_GIAIN|nr:hypothetical protein QR46_3494 [Giardia intestinalis assemblage B]
MIGVYMLGCYPSRPQRAPAGPVGSGAGRRVCPSAPAATGLRCTACPSRLAHTLMKLAGQQTAVRGRLGSAPRTLSEERARTISGYKFGTRPYCGHLLWRDGHVLLDTNAERDIGALEKPGMQDRRCRQCALQSREAQLPAATAGHRKE